MKDGSRESDRQCKPTVNYSHWFRNLQSF
uniref:Uncharacterized protein n=1 Tax=Anguilla anguilla TaxID=7936 RepID=A0A0E9TI88_ANGAN